MRPSLSTTGGDKGKTGLFGGERVSKSSIRLHAYGTIDELNALLGLVCIERDIPEILRQQLHQIQKDLFILGADLATPLTKEGKAIVRVSEDDIRTVEVWGKEIEDDLPVLQKFILPSGCRAAALMHLARTICRRAERWMVHLSEEEEINVHALVYINRLSDYFFLVSRSINKVVGTPEEEWLPR